MEPVQDVLPDFLRCTVRNDKHIVYPAVHADLAAEPFHIVTKRVEVGLKGVHR